MDEEGSETPVVDELNVRFAVRRFDETLDGVTFVLQGGGDPIVRNMAAAMAAGTFFGVLSYWPVGLLCLLLTVALTAAYWLGRNEDTLLTVASTGLHLNGSVFPFDVVSFEEHEVDELVLRAGPHRVVLHDPDDEVLDTLLDAQGRWASREGELRSEARQKVTSLVDGS